MSAEFGLNRRTVSAHLRRANVIRRGGLDAQHMDEVAALYQARWSAGWLARRFGVSPDTVLRTVRSASVIIRPRQG